MLVRHPPDRARRERTAPVQPAPPNRVAAVLALQRSAGNAAVARLLQRSPASFAAATSEIVKLTPGRAKTSSWPPVVSRITEYGLLSGDHGPRLAKLAELERAIQDWESKQAGNWGPASDLDKKKRAAVVVLTRLIARERQEMQRQPQTRATPQPPAPMVPPKTSAPISMGPRGDQTPAPAPDTPLTDGSFDEIFELQFEQTASAESPPEKKTEPPEKETKPPQKAPKLIWEQDELPKKPADDPQFPGVVHIRVHMTKLAYAADIHRTGLIAGAKEGIGLPNEHNPEAEKAVDPDWVYALDLSNQPTIGAVSQEAGGEIIGMVANTAGDKDPNYKAGAVRYPGQAPPVRDFPTEARHGGVYSFPLPMTPRSRTGLAAFVNQYAHGTTEEQAAKVVEVKLRRTIPLHVLRKFGRWVEDTETDDDD